jgi:hypothetical protein
MRQLVGVTLALIAIAMLSPSAGRAQKGPIGEGFRSSLSPTGGEGRVRGR